MKPTGLFLAAALREQSLKHNAAVEADGPDWRKTHNPNDGKAEGNEPHAKKKGKK